MENLPNYPESIHIKLLRDLYDDVKRQFPEFDEGVFLDKIQEVLLEDSIRNKSLKVEIERDGLDFQVNDFPLNDFKDAVGRCLLEIEVPEKEIDILLSRYV